MVLLALSLPCRMIDTSRDKAATCQYWSTTGSDIVTRVKHPFIPYRVHPIRAVSLTTPWDQWETPIPVWSVRQFIVERCGSFLRKRFDQIVWRSRSKYVRTYVHAEYVDPTSESLI